MELLKKYSLFFLTIILIAPFLGYSESNLFPPYTDKIILEKNAQDIIIDFIYKIKEHNCNPRYTPTIEIKTTPSLISWREKLKKVRIPFWIDLKKNQKEIFLDWTGNIKTAQTLFTALFNWFFIPHELTHFLQTEYDFKSDHFDSEKLANDYAVAFWMEIKGGEKKLLKIKTILQPIFKKLKDAFPKNENEREYFNKHYGKLGEDPNKYGYFQFKWVLDAIEKRNKLKLNTLSKIFESKSKKTKDKI
ncbi:MAG: hypothetical protein ABIA04_02485 [Pseudomonadota bacterium]